MGSIDECGGAAAAREIRDDIKHSGVATTFKFVGLKLGRKSRQRLLRFEKELGQQAHIAFATSRSDLTAVADWLTQKTTGTSDCADEVDNDGDDRVDGSDPECRTGDTEAPKQPKGECADEIDNDDDGNVDSADPECASGSTEAPKPTGDCHDGEDNDGDGRVDVRDPGCATSSRPDDDARESDR